MQLKMSMKKKNVQIDPVKFQGIHKPKWKFQILGVARTKRRNSG